MKKRRATNKKRRLLKWAILENKPLFFLFSTILACLLIIRATYAWETFSHGVENKFGSTDFKVSLKENFTPNKEWEPGRETVKEVYVQSQGHLAGFVRLKAEEFLLAFEMDVDGTASSEGTGNIQQYDGVLPTATIREEDVLSWKVNEYYENSGITRYKGIQTIPSTLSADGKGMIYGLDRESSRLLTDLKYLTLNFGEVIDYKPGLTRDYWKYDADGYFYYSECLMSGEASSLFLESTFLSSSTPNRLKGVFYKLEISMEGMEARQATLSEWGHNSPGDPIYEMLKGEITD